MRIAIDYMRVHGFGVLLALGAYAVPAHAAPVPTIDLANTKVVGPLGGGYAERDLPYFGTDLGYTFRHRGNMRIYFGDSWINNQGAELIPTGYNGDDTMGQICTSVDTSGCVNKNYVFLTGSDVDAFMTGQPAPVGKPSWAKPGPFIGFDLTPTNMTRAVTTFRVATVPYDTRLGRTPVAGFSTSPELSSGIARPGAFILFFANTPLACTNQFGTQFCPGTSFTCDQGLGVKAFQPEVSAFGTINTTPCAWASNDPFCTTHLPLCRNLNSSVSDNTPEGRVLSVVQQMVVGYTQLNNGAPASPDYVYTTWNTNLFANPVARTVQRFDATNNTNPNWATANGEPSQIVNQKVFIWGRPAFAGHGSRRARMYLAMTNLPQIQSNNTFAWQPQYYAGMNGPLPVWTNNETQAVPLPFVNQTGGLVADETIDIVNQMSITWVGSPVNKWIMFYGGDTDPSGYSLLHFDPTPAVVHQPHGAIIWRHADNPWGPWTVPSQPEVYRAWQSKLEGQVPVGPSPLLSYVGCVGGPSQCPRHEPRWDALGLKSGFLYGANIIEPWTAKGTVNGKPFAMIYWNLSTLDPYEVVLMKSTIVVQ